MNFDFLLQHWTWSLEIIILAAVLYQIWKLFRGTNGARVLTGLILLLLPLFVLSYYLKLTVISFLIRSFSAILMVALVVLFQPELRRFLAEFGGSQFLASSHQQIEVIEAVINAVESLQQDKMGALIAFEREIAYHPARETGTDLDAKVTSDLLQSLFFPKTPLHDGGVLIQGNRIVTAAAVFPLTEQSVQQRTLGLRHRAALGLSEQTDAVVVVLSEETGTLSLAVDGKLDRPLTADQLRAKLTELLVD